MEAPVETVIEKAAPEIQVQNGGENEPKTVGPEKQVPEENAKPKITDKKATKKTKEEKRNKEEEKRIKLLLRTFEGIDDEDAKLFAIAKKYVQLAADNKSLEHKKNDFESKNEKLTKERDTLQTDYNKATLAKSKLENLCRELQRHSKLVKEECQLRAQEEEAKRKELSDRFQTTINDISQQMQDNFKRNEQLKLENEDLAVKLKGLVSQYETREEHVDKVVQHKQLELQLSEAKMAQQSLQFNEMKEKSLMEKQELLKDSLDYRKRYEIMVLQEKELKAQLAMYTERFDDFQSTLNKSNEVFATFKTEMDKMSKTIKKLEKENKILKSRSDNTNRSLLAMLEERSSMETQIQTLTAKNSKLENLCRAMQKGVIQENKESSLPEKPETVGSSSTNNDNSNERTVDTNSSDSSKEPINTDQVPSNDQEQRKRGEPVGAEIQNGGDHVQEEELKNDGETVNNGQQENRESHNEETPVNNQQTDGETHSEEKPESDSNQSPESENTEVSKEDEKNEPTEVSESPSES